MTNPETKPSVIEVRKLSILGALVSLFGLAMVTIIYPGQIAGPLLSSLGAVVSITASILCYKREAK